MDDDTRRALKELAHIVKSEMAFSAKAAEERIDAFVKSLGMKHDPEPQTVDVLGSELRVGDVVVGVVDRTGSDLGLKDLWTVYLDGAQIMLRGPSTITATEAAGTYRVRLPRPVPVAPTSREGESDETFTKRNAIAKALRDVYFDRTSSILPDPLSWRMAQAVLDLPWEEPAAPSAKVRCPTCRCMIVPGSQCACCASTSGEYPPLPSTELDDAAQSASPPEGDIDAAIEARGGRDKAPGASDEMSAKRTAIARELQRVYSESTAAILPDPLSWRMAQAVLDLPWEEPTASGEEIAWAEGTRVVVQGRDARSNIDAGTAEFARWFAAEINLALTDATRALRERCERAEADRDGFQDAIVIANRAAERRGHARDAAIARAERAERVVEAVRVWANDECSTPELIRVIVAHDAARKDGAE